MPEPGIAAARRAEVTPAGAYHATSGCGDEPARRLLLGMLAEPRTPEISPERACVWSGLADGRDALALLDRMQSLGWIAPAAEARAVPRLHMERDVPALLAQLSGEGRTLLADADGLQLASCGFASADVERIAALAAELAGVFERHQGLLRGNLQLRAGGLAVVDAAGNSQLGLWPLAMHGASFLLVIGGPPLFNRPAFVDLVWGLVERYADRS